MRMLRTAHGAQKPADRGTKSSAGSSNGEDAPEGSPLPLGHCGQPQPHIRAATMDATLQGQDCCSGRRPLCHQALSLVICGRRAALLVLLGSPPTPAGLRL